MYAAVCRRSQNRHHDTGLATLIMFKGFPRGRTRSGPYPCEVFRGGVPLAYDIGALRPMGTITGTFSTGGYMSYTGTTNRRTVWRHYTSKSVGLPSSVQQQIRVLRIRCAAVYQHGHRQDWGRSTPQKICLKISMHLPNDPSQILQGFTLGVRA